MEEEKAAVEAEFNKLLCRLIIAANDLGAIDYAADNRQAYSREEAEIKQHGLQISVSEEYVSLLSANARLKAENERMRDALKSIVLDGIDMPAPQRREELINRMVDTANASLESEAPND